MQALAEESSSRTDGGLRRFRIGSAVTLPVSRLARRSVFILACVLADPATPDLLHRRLRALPLPAARAPVASGWSSSCRVGYLPPTGRARSFHGALGIWVKSSNCRYRLDGNPKYSNPRNRESPSYVEGNLLPQATSCNAPATGFRLWCAQTYV